MSPSNGRLDVENLQCPVAATMDLLMEKWTLHILRELMDGKKRFNELGRSLERAVSSRTLCCRLRSLEEQGILVRYVRNTIPPWVEYELTEKGRALNSVIDSIVDWGIQYMSYEIRHCRERGLAEPAAPSDGLDASAAQP